MICVLFLPLAMLIYVKCVGEKANRGQQQNLSFQELLAEKEAMEFSHETEKGALAGKEAEACALLMEKEKENKDLLAKHEAQTRALLNVKAEETRVLLAKHESETRILAEERDKQIQLLLKEKEALQESEKSIQRQLTAAAQSQVKTGSD
jgi:hypothetical protein